MNPILKLATTHIRKFKVVRSMPNRLRINITGVRQYPEIAKRFAPAIESVLEGKEGIAGASLCTITGNLLITYDNSKICEGEILVWMDNATKIVADFMCSPEAQTLSDAKIVKNLRKRLSSTR